MQEQLPSCIDRSMLGKEKIKTKVIDFHCDKIMHDWLDESLDFSVVKEILIEILIYNLEYFNCKAISSKISLALTIF